MYYIIGADGKRYGPAPIEVLKQWAAENRINAYTLVQKEGSSEWKPLYLHPELHQILEQQPVPPGPTYFPLHQGAERKIPAGICGILLGWAGIHKFILGYTRAGLIMLLVSLLTCFLASGIMWIIGLIEGIIYLTTPDEEFVKKYVQNRREWF